MGYCATQMDSMFYIKKENLSNALKAIKNMPSKEYAWVEEEFREVNNLGDMLNKWGWYASFDDEGNITSIDMDQEKLGDEVEMFKAIAPYVKENSYIEMMGEDGYHWRWIFDGETCIEKTPIVMWD